MKPDGDTSGSMGAPAGDSRPHGGEATEWRRIVDAREVLTGDYVRVEYMVFSPDEGTAIVEDNVFDVVTENGKQHVSEDLQRMLDKSNQRLYKRFSVSPHTPKPTIPVAPPEGSDLSLDAIRADAARIEFQRIFRKLRAIGAIKGSHYAVRKVAEEGPGPGKEGT